MTEKSNHIHRRKFIERFSAASLVSAALLALTLSALALEPAPFAAANELKTPLDRRAIVDRHRIQTDQTGELLPVGNGNICFNVDGTGLQTFKGDVLSHWGWFSEPLLERYTWDDVPETGTYQKGWLTGLDKFPADRFDLYHWIRESPHQMNLARTRFLRADGSELKPEEIKDVKRDLDLWTGVHTTTFTLDGTPVKVATCISDDVDLDSTVGIKIDSELVQSGKLVVEITFPYPSLLRDAWTGDFSENAVKTPFTIKEPTCAPSVSALCVKRELKNEYARGVVGDFSYGVRVAATCGVVEQIGETSGLFVKGTGEEGALEIAILFDGGDYSAQLCDDSAIDAEYLDYAAIEENSKARWGAFWSSGGAVDLSESSDERWFELERRIVLSQFLMRANSAGDWPCSESGLMNICPWSGRFHMEMIWWHLIHWWGWDRAEFADKAITVYPTVFSAAKKLAEQLEYKGVMWQKEIAPDGRTAPWEGNLVLLWKQPHPIYFAEMDYRRAPNQETIDKWSKIVEETAIHMADYPTRDNQGVYHLAPAMPPSEVGVTSDEIYDLVYWRWGLDMANLWRERQGKERNALWDDIRENLAPLPIIDDHYVRSAEWGDDFKTRNWEHPDLIGIYGMLPPIPEVDKETALRMLELVMKDWQWDRCWGWDFPMTAMAASRLGRPDLAVEILLSDSICNHYGISGVNLGGPSARGGKGEYLPGNAGLLFAIAGMCVGYDETTDGQPEPRSGDTAPGFPEGFSVKWENLKRPL